jgi:serine/threonine protein kinase
MLIGQTISHYKITEKLGEGGMGEVYLAGDTSLKRKVALKFLPDYLQQDEVAQKRFLREAQSAAALDHPFICKIFETGEAEGQSFIAMEYVKGQTLKEKLLEGPVPLKQTLQVGMEIAEALEEAHKAGIVHRDLKPANIMLTSGGHVKVI